MDDLSSKLNDILKNPESMEKIKNLAAMFGGQGALEAPSSPNVPAARHTEPEPQQQQEKESNAPALPSLDPEILRSVMKIAPTLSRMRQEDDSTRLLRALRPFLGEKRQKKLDEAIKLMQLARVVPFLKNSGIF